LLSIVRKLPFEQLDAAHQRRHPIEFELQHLFGASGEGDDEDESEAVIVGSRLKLILAMVNDAKVSGDARRCLFVGNVWSGSKVLANFLAEHIELIKGKRVMEVGAGAGMPELTAACLGAKKILLSDFPSKDLLDNLKENMRRNMYAIGENCEVSVVDLQWDAAVASEASAQFDVILSSECLCNSALHDALLRTLASRLESNGCIFLSFSHHFPGHESRDLSFFTKSSAKGLISTEIHREAAPQMWSTHKTTEVFFSSTVSLSQKKRDSTQCKTKSRGRW